MKLLISAFAICSLVATSCTKELSTQPTTAAVTSADSRSGHDDVQPDDRGGHQGGDNGGGGGVATSSIPPAVMQAFTARYSGATHIEWKKLADGTYKVEFFQGAVKVQAIFSATGKLLKEERR